MALSVNVTMFSTLRFFEGFCLAGIVLSLYALREYAFITHPNVYLLSMLLAVRGFLLSSKQTKAELFALRKL